MSEDGREFSGRSVDEAVAAGLRELGLRSNQVQIEIINKGSRGLFGIGSEPAIVKLILVPTSSPTHEIVAKAAVEPVAEAPLAVANEEEAETLQPASQAISFEPTAESGAKDKAEVVPQATANLDEEEADTESASIEMLSKMIELMGFKVTVEPVWKDSDDEHDRRVLWLEIHGKNLSPLIGRRGDTLENIQYLLRMMVNQRLHRWNDIVVDVDQYRTRRAEQISQLANRMAEQALSAGRAMALEPMPPNERRIVHMALRDHPNVYTQSSGEGERRKVYIVPKN